MTILIDDRTGSKEFLGHLKPPHETRRLPYGDFAFVGNGPTGKLGIGVERKTIPDLVQSFTSGRLSGHQLIGMVDHYDILYVVVEGIWRTNPDTCMLETLRRRWVPVRGAIAGTEVMGFLHSLTCIAGVRVWCTRGRDDTSTWLGSLYNWWQKRWDNHRTLKQFHVEPPARAYMYRPTDTHKILKEIPGVGWEKGQALEKRFGTVLEVALASMQELTEVPGIGDVLARKILDTLRGGTQT